MDIENSSMSKQASIQRDIYKGLGINVKEISTKTKTPVKLKTLFQMLRRPHPEIIHIHASSWWGFLPIIYGVIAAKLVRSRVWITYHGGDFQNFYNRCRWIVRPVLLNTEKIIVGSLFLEEIFKEFGFDRVSVIPNVIDESFIRLGENKLNPIGPRFIITRSLEPEYDIELSIKSIDELRKRFPNTILRILGNGCEMKHLKELCERRMCGDNVKFYGYIPNSMIHGIYQISDFMINTSRIDNMPVSLLEGMACGLCVVSTPAGGIPHVVEDGENGILFSDREPAKIARTLEGLLLDKEKTRLIIENGKRTVREKYSLGHAKNLYRDTLKGYRA